MRPDPLGGTDTELVQAISRHPVWQVREDPELAVVLAHFNPCDYRRPVLNLLATLDQLLDLNASVYLAYLTFPHRPCRLRLFTSDLPEARVRVLETSTVWFHKEPLWNQAVANLVPVGVDKILLLDADVLFASEDPLARVSEQLDRHRVVHPLAFVTYLGPDGRAAMRRPSLGSAVSRGFPGATDPRRYTAGFGMALQRSFWAEVGGLYLAPVGGGDTLLCAAATGRWRDLEREFNAQSPASWAGYRSWAARVESWSSGTLAAAPNEIVHQYHGTRTNRRYDERRSYLNGFDSRIHVTQEINGLPGWSQLARSTAPRMVAAVESHFTRRREDD